jgi:SAM-dependent methyltransferase
LFKEQTIISKWIADMYDQYVTDTNDIEFLMSVIGTEPKRILEIACGSGRILVPMAKAGHNVTGLDFDEYIMSKIAPKVVGMDNITWCKADVIGDDWGTGFDIVVMAANFLFNIITDIEYDKAQQLLIQKAANALISGGSIYIDYGYTLHPEKWFGNPGVNVIWEGKDSDGNTGRMTLLNSTFDKESGINKFVRRFELTLTDGEMILEDIPSLKHFATLEQIKLWLSSAGFIVKEVYGDYNYNPIDEKTRRAIIWAKKV